MFRDNLFTVIKLLESAAKNKLSSSIKNDRLHKLLVGDDKVVGLYDLAKGFDQDGYRYLQQEVDSFYQATTVKEFSLWLALKRTKLVLSKMVNTNQVESDFQQASAKKHAYACMQDDIYAKTTEKFNGLVIVPITQAADYRQGNSDGECAGYVIAWAQALLSKKPPFGIRHEQGALFKPVKFDSKVGRKYPDLNHGIVLTKRIAAFQQKRNKTKFDDCDNNKEIYRSMVSMPDFFKDGKKIADTLVQLATQNRDNVYYLAIHGQSGGHAIGYYLDENGCSHFLDVNAGWFKFSSDDVFSSWLDFYFKRKKYDQTYSEFFIYSYGFEIEKKISLKDWLCHQPRFFALKFRSYQKSSEFESLLHARM